MNIGPGNFPFCKKRFQSQLFSIVLKSDSLSLKLKSIIILFMADNNKKATSTQSRNVKGRRQVLSVSQLLVRVQKQKQRQLNQKKRQKPMKPIIPPKSLMIILKDRPEKAVYNRRIIDYKHCGLLQRYIGLGGKILPRRQTKLTAKQQRYIAKTIKTARIMGLLPFVTKERGFFR